MYSRMLLPLLLLLVAPPCCALSGMQINISMTRVGTEEDERSQPHPYAAAHGEDEHVVTHREVLNKQSFWWLMAALITLIAMGVVRVQLDGDESMRKGGRGGNTANGDVGGLDSAQDRPYSSNQIRMLMFCAVALISSMTMWGVAQEFVMTNTYARPGDSIGEHFPSTVFLVLCNRVGGVFFSSLLLRLLNRPFAFSGFAYGALPAITNSIASWCQYHSLMYVSFTLQTTVKSAKLIPVVLLSTLRGKRYSWLDYAEFAVISAGLAVLGREMESGSGVLLGWTAFGILLLVMLVLFDSCTPHFQDSLFHTYPDVDAIQASFAMSSWATCILFLALLCTGMLMPCLSFIGRHPESLLHVGVLTLSSTMVQFLISLTIKLFGPVVFTLIVSMRLVVSVGLSAVLFQHHMTVLAVVAVLVVCGTTCVRSIRPGLSRSGSAERQLLLPPPGQPTVSEAPPAPCLDYIASVSEAYGRLIMCVVALHLLYGFYAVSQEFLATHTFEGKIFAFPMFLVAVTHFAGAVFAIILLRFQGIPLFAPSMSATAFPAAANCIATICQHWALYFIFFPTQTLMKSLKMLPVMVIGTLLRNRNYSTKDYIEALVITGLVGFFVWRFQLQQSGGHTEDLVAYDSNSVKMGLALMVGYIIVDPFTSNLEDYVYQVINLDPGQMLLGMQLSSAVMSALLLTLEGDLIPACSFVYNTPDIWLYLAVMALAAATGAYTCELIVRLFGPAVFTLLMMSRQVMSLIISVYIFNHQVDTLSCMCLVLVCCIILSASVRHVRVQREAQRLVSAESDLKIQK